MENKFLTKPDKKPFRKTAKTIITANETLHINVNKKQKVQEIYREIKELFKKSSNSEETVLKYIKTKGSKVIKSKHMDKALKLVGEKEGFITPLKGTKALFLSIMINILSPVKISIGFNTPEMFIFQDKPYNIQRLIHQVYHWISFLEGLPGYEDSTASKFKDILNNNLNFSNINNMPTSEIIALKEAISRDIEAIDLVTEVSRESIEAKRCIEKMKNGESLSI